MKTICKRLHRGDDLLKSIQALAKEHAVEAGVVLSAVGCISKGVVRNAGGVRFVPIDEPCEIVSLNGTVSQARCHLHIALSKEDLTTVGGHLVEGCIINTTCELVIGVLDGWRYGVEQDDETGYDELVFEEIR